MRLYIAQPWLGRTDEELSEEHNRIVDAVQDEYNEEISVIELSIQLGKPSLWQLGAFIQRMSAADLVYFAKGWEKSRVCRILNECVREYGIRFAEET